MQVKLDTTSPDSPWRIIKLTHGMEAIVDADLFEELDQYCWHAKKSYCRWYACRKEIVNSKEVWIRMHRQIMKTPRGLICHHKHHNTMDNRRCELENMTQKFHHNLHVQQWPRLILREKTQEPLQGKSKVV